MDETALELKMQEVLDLVAGDLSSIRTGRATPALVEDLFIQAYGGTQRLRVQELATILAQDAQTLVIEPWDKSIIGEIRQGILAANIGLNPAIDGQLIRISLPPLTAEDRQKYVKLLSTKIENGKVMIRRIRSDSMRDIKESFEKKEISEDEKFSEEKRLQAATDEFVAKLEEMEEVKKTELLTI